MNIFFQNPPYHPAKSSKMQKSSKIFGTYRKSSYLCSVKSLLLAIRAESREGKTISTLPILKELQSQLFLFLAHLFSLTPPSLYKENLYTISNIVKVKPYSCTIQIKALPLHQKFIDFIDLW